MRKPNTLGPAIIAVMVMTLIVLHQDNWMWDNDKLVAGFMPIQLLYHAGISMAAAITWLTATKIAWPVDLEQNAESSGGSESSGE